MRRLILFDMMTLDGFFAGPGGDIGWHRVDNEFDDFTIEQLGEAGGMVFGRVTYELMASFWPTPEVIESDPVVAAAMNSLPKWVVSRTLHRADYENSRLVAEDPVEAIRRLKQAPGKDLFVFGSAKLAATLIRSRLIDEYRVMVNPIVLGSGRPLFENVREPTKLKLLRSRTFGNGNVLLCYEPVYE